MKSDLVTTLIGDHKTFPPRHRVFNVLLIVGTLMSFSAVIINYFLDLGTLSIIVPFVFGFMVLGLYLASRKERMYELPATLSTILLSFFFFPVMWLINGGTKGGIPYYFIINAGVIGILLTGLKRLVTFLLFIIVVIILIVIEYWMPHLIVGYQSEAARYYDLSFGLFICLFANVLFISTLIDNYEKERQKAKNYLMEIKKQSKEIAIKNRKLERSYVRLKEAKERTEQLNRLLTEEKQKLQKLSITDYLTGTFNKEYIITRLKEEIQLSHLSRKKLTVALIDIDDFKKINDTNGHLFGDYALQRIAKIIKENIRQNDIVGRFGGDEFLIILPNTDWKEGYAVTERTRKKILALNWKNNLKITVSGGVAELGDEKFTSLFERIDKLLYKAKLKDKNIIEKEI